MRGVNLGQAPAQGRRRFLPVFHNHKGETFTVCSSFARKPIPSQDCVRSSRAYSSPRRRRGIMLSVALR
jgi:hypothetical protein